MTPADLGGEYDADDPSAAAIIQAVTETIDGPDGWLGRCLGPQRVEWALDCWPSRDDFRMPIGPEIEIESVTYVDPAGGTQIWPFSTPLYFDNLPAVRGRRGDIRIVYWAGYGKRNTTDPTKWDMSVPERARQAIILSARHLLTVGSESLFMSADEVEGIGRTQYTVTDQATKLIEATADRLLAGLRVYA